MIDPSAKTVKRKDLRKLKSVYKTAKGRGEVSFMLDGEFYLTQYAKYVIEYAETKKVID